MFEAEQLLNLQLTCSGQTYLPMTKACETVFARYPGGRRKGTASTNDAADRKLSFHRNVHQALAQVTTRSALPSTAMIFRATMLAPAEAINHWCSNDPWAYRSFPASLAHLARPRSSSAKLSPAKPESISSNVPGPETGVPPSALMAKEKLPVISISQGSPGAAR